MVQVAFASSTGVNLRLHGYDFGAQVVVSGQRLVDRGAVNAFQHGHTVLLEKCFSLILVNVHAALQMHGLKDRLSILWRGK